MLKISQNAPFNEVTPSSASPMISTSELSSPARLVVSSIFSFPHALCFPQHFPQSSSAVNGFYLSLYLSVFWPSFRGHLRYSVLHGAFPMGSSLTTLGIL